MTDSIHRTTFAGWLLMALSRGVEAQTPLNYPVGQEIPYALASGPRDNHEQQPQTVFSALIELPGSAWLRLYFGKAALGDDSFLRVTSLLDNQSQELDAPRLASWQNTTAYFNGNQLLLELVAGPRTTDNSVELDRIAFEPAGMTAGSEGLCGICEADDRAPSTQNWVGRLMPAGCTASIWNEQSCAISAGHCMQANLLIQFRVPASDMNCLVKHPPIAEQFPVTSFLFERTGVGRDWAALTIGVNNLNQTPYARYGELRRIATSPAATGDPVDVAGYGIECLLPPCSDCPRSQTQQAARGQIDSREAAYYTFTADVTFGNSGSALLWDGKIVGVVTHCGFDCPNYATRVNVPAFSIARASICAGGGCDGCDANCDGSVNQVDIEAFVNAFRAGGGECSACAGDATGDGSLNIFDVQAFIDCLTR